MYVIRVFTILIALNLADAFFEDIMDEAIVSLQENIYGSVWAHICTGVLVGKQKLMLTAAHCFENKMHLVKGYSPPRLQVKRCQMYLFSRQLTQYLARMNLSSCPK